MENPPAKISTPQEMSTAILALRSTIKIRSTADSMILMILVLEISAACVEVET